jgi:hypothetical protein
MKIGARYCALGIAGIVVLSCVSAVPEAIADQNTGASPAQPSAEETILFMLFGYRPGSSVTFLGAPVLTITPLSSNRWSVTALGNYSEIEIIAQTGEPNSSGCVYEVNTYLTGGAKSLLTFDFSRLSSYKTDMYVPQSPYGPGAAGTTISITGAGLYVESTTDRTGQLNTVSHDSWWRAVVNCGDLCSSDRLQRSYKYFSNRYCKSIPDQAPY